jgi:hypothetical protein
MSVPYDVLSGEPLPSRKFGGAQELREFLQGGHVDGKFLYRGQARRYTHRYEIISPGRLATIEALYPSDFRFVGKEQKPPQDNEWITLGRENGRNIRNRFFDWMERYVEERCDPAFDWLAKIMKAYEAAHERLMRDLTAQVPGFSSDDSTWTPETQRIYDDGLHHYRLGLNSTKTAALWSLAQHYELSTALIDLTEDIDVAIWFATNEWRACRPKPDNGFGCVYRFDLPRLAKVLTNYRLQKNQELASLPGFNRVPAFFVRRLSNIISGGALRPAHQRGASVFGFDQPLVLLTIAQYAIVEVFEFEHGPHDLDLGKVDREYIIPADDLGRRQNRCLLSRWTACSPFGCRGFDAG